MLRILVAFLTLVAVVDASRLAGQDVTQLKAIETHQLHNVWQLSPRVLSGSQPDDEAGFAELARLGVTTIVSVDGIRPQVELARKYGLRYVHVPIGYDGVEPEAQASITRVARDIQGKIYVHCHHGKHRGPAAAAILCRADDGRSPAAAKQILEKAGTGKEYAGLWRDVEHFEVPRADAALPALVESAEVESLAAAMAKIDRIFDRLKELDRHQWQSETEEPLQLEELFAESARTERGELQAGLSASAETTKQLREAIRKRDPSTASQTLKQLTKQCTACHQQHRN